MLPGEWGSECPRVLSRQKTEAEQAVPGSTDPDTSSSGCSTDGAGCQAWWGAWGELPEMGGGWQWSSVEAGAQRGGPNKDLTSLGAAHSSIIAEHQLYCIPGGRNWVEGEGLGVRNGIERHLWPHRNCPPHPQVVSVGSSKAERPPAAWY